MSFTGPSLRDRLRTGTRLAQDGVERAQRRFDFARPGHIGAFLAAQRDAVVTLRGVASELEDALQAACDRLDADLAELGHGPGPKTYPAPRSDHRVACGFVWHSQQLALRTMTRRLPDAATRGLRFLTHPRNVSAWRVLCDELERTPGYEGDATLAVTATNDRLALLETIHMDHARACA
ncbi:biliverdin-producing heme oxygenase [Jannaschia donghaensis]|uniref:Heme oxygenase n=1 Tax=Jannaschia donghaensis TaxID=420998 RepID=A0A0M6YIS5_9RHOB|nr:biliverdin-producing heme oxygenase [Jannaschia donghaensis]CTQ49824.1 hypothetical protein JDO7802_01841 [Jannaschia donghaensis]